MRARPGGELVSRLIEFAALGVIYLLSPLVGWLALSFYFAHRNMRSATVWSVFIGFSPIAIEINLRKAITGDWDWYTSQYAEYQHLQFWEIFGTNLFPPNQVEEPLYYLAAWTLANTTMADVTWLTVFICVVSYGLAAAGLVKIVRLMNLKSHAALVFSYIVLSHGVVLSLVTHLVRQTLATSLLLLAIAFLMEAKPRPAIAMMLTASLTHTPAAVLATIFGAAYLLRKSRLPFSWAALMLLGPVAGFAYWWLSGRFYDQTSDGQVSVALIFLDLAGVILAGAIVQKTKVRPGEGLTVLIAGVIGMLGFVAGTGLSPIPALRFYFYLAPFFAILLAWVFVRVPFSWPMYLRAALAALGAVVEIQVRLLRSPFGFGGGLETFF